MSTDTLPPLVPCPLCGESNGYTLRDGSDYRWWHVSCLHCGTDVGECRSDRSTTMGLPKPARWPAADHAWNEVGRYANDLRRALIELAAANAWHNFGECRAWGDGPILMPHEADELARRVLGR